MAIMSDIGKPTNGEPPEAICIFMETLQEGVDVMDIPDSAKAIIVRTNITLLADSIDKDLYVKSQPAAQISQLIHERLQSLGHRQSRSTPGPPVEPGTPHPLE